MFIAQRVNNIWNNVINYFRSRNALYGRLLQQQGKITKLEQLLQLKLLQTRMNPHFLFNSLNAIQYFVMDNDKKASLQYIRRFSIFLRKIIHCGDELFITVQDEVELLTEYLWLEHCRFPERFSYEIVTEGPSVHSACILPLLTHGLVEEALYNRILNLPADKQGKLMIRFELQQDHLLVTVTDDGRDRETQGDSRDHDLTRGKENVQHRIEVFNRHSANWIRYDLHKQDHPGENSSTTGSLQIPFPLDNPVHTLTHLKM